MNEDVVTAIADVVSSLRLNPTITPVDRAIARVILTTLHTRGWAITTAAGIEPVKETVQ